MVGSPREPPLDVGVVSAETMNRIAKAAERVERLEARLAETRAELHAAIRQAHAQGARPATLARVAGLSRERIRQILSSS
jgi:DNA-binding phage protein